MNSMGEVTIIGAGIVGMCTAVTLQQRGWKVKLIDERAPGTGASFGNAGLVSIDSCIPISMPGMIKKIPGWLSDREGPLSLRKRYLPTALPWLLQWLHSGSRRNSVMQQARALRALHGSADSIYRSLLGAHAASRLIKTTGQLHVWEQHRQADPLSGQIQADNGVVPRLLDAQEVRDLIPGISNSITHGQLYEKNGFASTPLRLVQALLQQFLDNGGQLICQKVNGISRDDASGDYRLILATQNARANRLVICAGAWANRLLNGLNIHVPLETERGYHVSFDPAALSLPLPIMDKTRAIAMTPMADSLRVAGFVEIAGLDVAPNMSREHLLIRHAKTLFPSLDIKMKKAFWLGFRPSTPDSLPILDRVPHLPGLYLGFGHGHTGMTGAPKSAEILADLISGTASDIDITPYRFNRF